MEKHALSILKDNQDVINIYQTFQDDLNLYLVMEYVPNGELWK